MHLLRGEKSDGKVLLDVGDIGVGAAGFVHQPAAFDDEEAVGDGGVGPAFGHQAEYLALPRILAVTLMVPLLAVFATFVGVFGGMIVACAGDLSVEQYLTQAIRAISFKSFLVGFIKSIAFGFIDAWAGCYRGSVAKPSALGVGEAATTAAVLGITLIVVSDALFAVIFNLFNF